MQYSLSSDGVWGLQQVPDLLGIPALRTNKNISFSPFPGQPIGWSIRSQPYRQWVDWCLSGFVVFTCSVWSERCKPTRCWTDAEVRRRQTCLHVVAARCLPVTSNPPVFQDQPSASYWTHDKSDWAVSLEILSCLTGQCIENSLWCWEQVVSFSGNQIHFPLCLCTPCAFAYPRRGSTWCHLAGLSVFWEIRVVICDSVSVIVATLSRLWKNSVCPSSTDPCIFSFVFLVHCDHWGPLLFLLIRVSHAQSSV